MNYGPFSFEKHFVVLRPNHEATLEECDNSLYERLDRNYSGFAKHELVACHVFTENWTSWEIHPKGDEVVVLLAGEVEFVLRLESEQRSVILDDVGQYAIVPKNTWHTARVNVESKVLFITPGEDTQHKTE